MRNVLRGRASGQLQRSLQNRHIQLIGLGGAVGTGLFLGSAGVLRLAGPAMLLGYAVAGALVFLIMRFLGEMLVEEPVSNSYSHFAHEYWGPFAGFFSGWNTVALYVLVGMLELTAVGHFLRFWWPAFPDWISVAVGLGAVSALNLFSVRSYGEAEFWFALVKIVAVLGMIAFGLYLLVAHHGEPGTGIANLWAYGGFAPQGLGGVLMALGVIAFSYGGLEQMGFAAGETRDAQRVIPRAINQIVYRILVFYVGSSFVLLTILPWPRLLERLSAGGGTYSASPFALVFAVLGDDTVANLLNAVVLAAALSVCNSTLYAASRMLHGMAHDGNAPAALGSVNRRGVPVRSIAAVSVVIASCVVVNYFAPHRVVEMLLALVTAALVLIWALIICTHLRFRAAMSRRSARPRFPAPLAPWSNLLCLGFVALVVVVLSIDPSTRSSVYAIPIWIAAVYLAFRLRQRARRVAVPAL